LVLDLDVELRACGPRRFGADFSDLAEGRMRMSGPEVTVLTHVRVSMSRSATKSKTKPLLLAE